MRKNRSCPDATVLPQLAYPDPRWAADWLCAAFGFTTRLRIANHRIQLNVGDGALIITEQGDRDAKAFQAAQSIMVRVENADAHCAQARAAGAKIVSEPTDYPYGERQYAAEDFAGRQWKFTQTTADIDPSAWGGEAVSL